MQRELLALKRQRATTQSKSADLRLEVSAVADVQFRAQFLDDAATIDQILLRLKNVDGIFAAELGVQIQVPTVLIEDGSALLESIPSLCALLSNLAPWRAYSPLSHARALTPLITGRDLNGTPAGMGHVGSLCDPEHGVALTEVRHSGDWL